MRFGTRTDLKRRWTRQGIRPKTPIKIGYQFRYLYCSICPSDGDLFAAILPRMTQQCFHSYMEHFEQHLKENYPPTATEKIERIDQQDITKKHKTLIIADGATNHRLKDSQQFELIKLPKACPELNPVERFFKELRAQIANRVFDEIAQMEKVLIKIVKQHELNPKAVKQLTLFPYIKNNTS